MEAISAIREEVVAMAITADSFPPPIGAPAPPAATAPAELPRVGPVAFQSYSSPRSGSRSTVFIDDPVPGTFTVTGEFFAPAKLAAYRIGQTILLLLGTASLIGAFFAWANTEDGSSSPTGAVLLVIGIAAIVAQLIWKLVLWRSARPATLQVRAPDLQRVRSTLNFRMLLWWLLIGPFALIPLFAGRRLLRMEVPVVVDGRGGMLPLFLMEQRRGDAQATVLRLRLAGAR